MSPKEIRAVQLEEFLKEVEKRCKRELIPFTRSTLPGSKRDFIKALRFSYSSFNTVSESTVESSLHDLNCKFPNGGRVCANDTTIKTLFKECFQ